jgi:hypothetical protein
MLPHSLGPSFRRTQPTITSGVAVQGGRAGRTGRKMDVCTRVGYKTLPQPPPHLPSSLHCTTPCIMAIFIKILIHAAAWCVCEMIQKIQSSRTEPTPAGGWYVIISVMLYMESLKSRPRSKVCDFLSTARQFLNHRSGTTSQVFSTNTWSGPLTKNALCPITSTDSY